MALPSKRRCLIACRRGYRPLHEFDGAAMFIRFTPYIGKNRNEHDVGEAWFKSLPLANAALYFLWLPARAAGALLYALHESRMRAAAKLIREFAHRNVANQGVAGQRPTPPQ
ncbi:hypothetical protein [Bradyrhizobium erythrophlei]|nr:hypothetical protein [Bradyrhizobium erythrophlei]